MQSECSESARDLEAALSDLQKYTDDGFTLAEKTRLLFAGAVHKSIGELQKDIQALRTGNFRDDEVAHRLTEQLDAMRKEYESLPLKMKKDIDLVPKGTFSITLFGRTTAGKSTLMTVLTHGDGSKIGNGSQRTTRDVRSYSYRGLEITDVPGIAAFGGADDQRVAFESAEKSDLILFLITDDAPQKSEAECLSRIKSLGKPIICLVNVKVGIRPGSDMTDRDFKNLSADIEEKFDDREGLEAIRRSLIAYAPEYNQDWQQIPFAYVHLKAAYMAQQDVYKKWSERLYELSHFRDVEMLMVNEICKNGGFCRFKTYADIVSVPLVGLLEKFFSQSAQANIQGMRLVEKKHKYDEWISDFKRRADAKIKTLISTITDDLKREASSFSEDNFGDKDASRKWASIIESRHFENQANELLRGLGYECEAELRDIAREIDYDMGSSWHGTYGGTFAANNVVDSKRIWDWATAGLSGALAIGGILAPEVVVPFFIVASIAVAAVGAVGGLFIPDYENKKHEAIQDMESQLFKNISEYTKHLDDELRRTLNDKLLGELMYPMSRRIDENASLLFGLGGMQRKLAIVLNGQLRKVNFALISAAAEYRGHSVPEGAMLKAARIPGSAILLVHSDRVRLSHGLMDVLQYTLGEDVKDVIDTDDEKTMFSRVIDQQCDRNLIHIERTFDIPTVMHVSFIDDLKGKAYTGARLAKQVLELQITK